MEDLTETYTTTTEVANILGINPKSAGLLARRGRIHAVKIANRWLIPRAFIEGFAQTYVAKRGRPRRKRKYTRSRQI